MRLEYISHSGLEEPLAERSRIRRADEAGLGGPASKRRLLGDEEHSVLRELGASISSAHLSHLGAMKEMTMVVSRMTDVLLRLETRLERAKLSRDENN